MNDLQLKEMMNILKKWIITIFFDIHSSLISIIVGVILVGGIGLSLSFQDIRLYIYKKLQISMPIWIVILIVIFCILLTGVIIIYRRNRDNEIPYKIKYITVMGYKWEVKIYKHYYFEVEKTPICINHNLKLVSGREGMYCPEVVNNECDSIIPPKYSDRFYLEVESYIDKIVRDKQITLFQRITSFFYKHKRNQ